MRQNVIVSKITRLITVPTTSNRRPVTAGKQTWSVCPLFARSRLNCPA